MSDWSHIASALARYGIGASQRMLFGQFTGVTSDTRGQLDRPSCAPKLLPALFRLRKAIPVEVVGPVRTSER